MTRPSTLSSVAERIRSGTKASVAIPEFVDEFLAAGSRELRLAMIAR